MLDAIVNHFLQSKEGGDILAQLKTHGLDRTRAAAAVHATAEGAMEQLGAGGIAGVLGGEGGLEALAAGVMGNPSGAAGGTAGDLAAPVAHFVAQKLGLSPTVARTVVDIVLPRVLALLPPKGGPATQKSALGAMLGR